MSTTGASADPLAALGSLPGVAESVESVRKAVDRVYGHRVMRRRSNEITSEAALRGARGSAALSGADWALEEVRRRTDFGVDDEARVGGRGAAADRRGGPTAVHLAAVAAAGAGPAAPGGRGGQRGRGRTAATGRRAGRRAAHRAAAAGRRRGAGRLEGLSELVITGSSAPALVMAAVVHGELLALRPFTSRNGLVARAAERIVLVGSGLDPKSVCPAEVGHAELGRAAYLAALDGYVSGTPEGMAAWIAHCGRAVELGARESTAVCEALQRGAA